MATIIDVINASKGLLDGSNQQTLRNFLILNDDWFEETDYTNMVTVLNTINSNYIAPYATSMYGKQPAQLTDSEIFTIRNTMTIAELESAWNNYFQIWDNLSCQISIEFSNSNWVFYYSIIDGSTTYIGVCWVEYNTPSDGDVRRPNPIVNNNNGCILSSDYLSTYSYKGQSLGWYDNSALSGTQLQVNDVITAVDGKVQLYTGIPTPSKIVRMHNKITENNVDVKYDIYPVTKASAVYLNNGDTVEATIGDIETALSTINTTLGGMV